MPASPLVQGAPAAPPATGGSEMPERLRPASWYAADPSAGYRTGRGAVPSAAERVAEVDRLFGDPAEPANALGHAAVLAADERDELFSEGERALDRYRLSAEFVPRELGGRFSSLEDLIRVMRVVFRRDPCLGLGYGISSFIASVNVWTAGSGDQRDWLAGRLLGGEKASCAYHELAHGNDFAGVGFAARRGPEGDLRLSGRKEVVTNMTRARAIVLLARTSDRPGSRSHSQLLVDAHDFPADRVRDLPRFPSTGMRGVQLGGMEFDDCPVPGDAVLGREGQGIETALRSFQLTRTGIPAMLCGGLDAALRLACDFTAERRLYGGRAADLPLLRAMLADAFTDLLICDAFGRTVARAIHLVPDQTSVYASAVKYLTAERLLGAVHRLSLVMGSAFYLRQGRYGYVQKLLRDLKPAGFGHAAKVACLATMLPQLPLLARRSWTAPGQEAVPEALFRIGGALPPLDFARLRVGSSGQDALVDALFQARDALAAGQAPATGPQSRRLAALAEVFCAEASDLAARCAALPPRELGVDATPEALRLPARYASVLAASACLNIWLRAGSKGTADGEGDTWTDDPAWAVAALERLAAGLGRTPDPDGGTAPASARALREHLFAELSARHEGAFSLDLDRYRLPG